MQEDIINKLLRSIFSNISKYKHDKSIYIWAMGTDFFLHLKRWNWISKKIRDQYLHEDTNVKIEWIQQEKHGWIKIFDQNLDSKEEKIIINNGVFGRSKSNRNQILSEGKKLGKSTLRQFFEVGVSFGYISSDTKFSSNNTFTLQRIFNIFNDNNDKDMIDFFINIIEDNWNIKSLKGVSIRDIALTIVLTYFIFNGSKIGWAKSLIGSNKLKFRKNKFKGLNYSEILVSYKKENSSLKKQTIINNHKNNNYFYDEYKKLLFFINEKLLSDWNVDETTIVNKTLEDEIKSNQKRNNQPVYRQQMLNALKRYQDEKGYFNRHDILTNITNSTLVEASHILDYKDCKEDEEYDPENGILLDPSTHKYFDKDLITIDINGYVYAKKEYINEIKKVLPWARGESKINEKVLSSKTIKYIERRLDIHKINLSKYIRI